MTKNPKQLNEQQMELHINRTRIDKRANAFLYVFLHYCHFYEFLTVEMSLHLIKEN